MKPSTNENNEQTVFVVDDEPDVRAALRLLIKSVGYQVECFESADSFFAQFETERKGCLILDVRMPGMSGMELQDKLSSLDTLLPIIMISGHGEIPMAVKAVQNGAVDFLQKPFSDQQLLDRISQAMSLNTVRHDEYSIRKDAQDKYVSLTPREREIFTEVVSGKLNKVIAYELNISTRTVEIHRAKAMEKMAARNLSELINLANLLKE
ncbi:response regulator transcription factor [sulfur-oxidizing endosymbiont of Gigantopelta aegis]|uniref:response regulator transcription factor n=1 Tax=sulfur-oxidizing endosymbiont of Gigantopelta aegis TaxID=2794934 RepID=UPI0018DB2B14|nr:response regulator transcription factor [sulfur-oxidizing endosymbiont of Gigantopelta aegis]